MSNLDIPSALAALDGAVRRLRDLVHRLRAGAQARLGRAGAAPTSRFAGTPVIPTVRYRDVPAAVKWLCRAFGMRVHRIVTDASGAPRYAELTVGSGMLIVAPIEDTAFGKLMVQPDEIGGVETQVCYLRVSNARAHYARAKAAGAVIVIDPEDEANKGRGYSCRDPEGHVWNFGTYDPWEARPSAPPGPLWRLGRLWSLGPVWRLARLQSLGRVQQGLAAAFLLALAAALALELLPQPSARAGTAVTGPQAAVTLAGEEHRSERAQPPPEEAAAGEAAKDAPAPHEVRLFRVALETAERSAADARAQLAEVRGELAKVEREAATARSRLQEMQSAKLAAERAATEAQRAAEAARGDVTAAQESAERARAQSARERARRRAAVRAAVAARRRAAWANRAMRRWHRTWCYGPYVPPTRPGRLNGFCAG